MVFYMTPTEPVTWSEVKRDRLLVQHRDGRMWIFLNESLTCERWLCLNDGHTLENDMTDQTVDRTAHLDQLNDAWAILA